MNVLSRRSAWYGRQCDGDWEHRKGVSIERCGNPGWWVTINLEGTTSALREFPRVAANIEAHGFATVSR